MSDESEKASAGTDDRWTVRGVGAPERAAAKRAADKADQSIGEWLTAAIRGKIQADKAGTNVPAVVGLTSSDTADSLGVAERVAEQVRGLAAAGIPVSKTQAAKVVSALTKHLSAGSAASAKPADKSD